MLDLKSSLESRLWTTNDHADCDAIAGFATKIHLKRLGAHRMGHLGTLGDLVGDFAEFKRKSDDCFTPRQQSSDPFKFDT